MKIYGGNFMANKFFDDEKTWFNKIQRLERKDISLLTNDDEEAKIAMLVEAGSDADWTIVAEDTNFPPDIYSDKYKLMGDFMMVDDSGFIKHKKKKDVYINPQNEADSRAYRDLINAGILDMFPNLKEIYINSDTTNLKTNEHHTFSRYVDEFNRIVQAHIDNIPEYKKNHPGYQTIFFIMDKSSGYFKTDCCLYSDEYLKSNPIQVETHYPFVDSNFLNIFKNSGIDFVVWFMPYKIFKTPDGFKPFPIQMVVLNVKNIDSVQQINYPKCLMISSEK